jgi:hypothetical protein
MKHARVFGFTVLLALAMLVSLFNSPAFASAETKASAVPSVSASGRGWFVFNGFRHNFGFAVHEGKLNEASGWRYAPKSFVFLSVFNFEGTKIFELRSVFVWRFRTEEADGDAKVLIVGVANVTTSKGVLEKWWFRMEGRDIDSAEKGVDSLPFFCGDQAARINQAAGQPGFSTPTTPRAYTLTPLHSTGHSADSEVASSKSQRKKTPHPPFSCFRAVYDARSCNGGYGSSGVGKPSRGLFAVENFLHV